MPHSEIDFAEVLAAAVAQILAAQRILIICHRQPDADTLGSALAMKSALEKTGRQAGIIAPDPFPVELDYLPGFADVGTIPDHVDLVITVDASSANRLVQHARWLDQGIPVVAIDHHISNTMFGTLNLVDVEAAASAEIVSRLIRAAGLPLDADVATCLYAGLLRDTSGFRSEKTTAATLRLAADFVAAGADPAMAAQRIFGESSLRQLRVEAYAVATMRQEPGGLIWSEITEAVAAGATEPEVEAAVEQLARAAEANIAIILHEVAPDSIEVHIRTKPPYDAAAMATGLGGGGHVRRAGARVSEPLEAARARVLETARAELDSHAEATIS